MRYHYVSLQASIRRLSILLPISCIYATSLNAQDTSAARTAPEGRSPLKTMYAKGLRYTMKDSSFSVKVGFRFQTLMQLTTTSDDPQRIDGRMMIRRSRLKFDGFAFSPRIVCKAELALSNSDIGNPVPEGSSASNVVLDAVLKWRFAKNSSLWFGQTKLPGNRERVVSSQNLQFVDRSNLNAEYNIDRDAGFQLHNQFEIGTVVVRDIYAVSMGEGRNITALNRGGLDYTARLEVLPFGEFTNNGDYVNSDIYRQQKPKLSLALTYDYNDDASKEKGQLGKFLPGTSDLQTVFADMMFMYRGLSVMAEYADKRGSTIAVRDEDGKINGRFVTGTGLNTQAGYLFKNNWEPAFRYTQVNPDKLTNVPHSWMYTVGVSHYVVGHNLKFQIDMSMLDRSISGFFRC